MRRLFFATVAAASALVLLPAGAGAGPPPLSVSFVVPTTFLDGGSGGPFTATGIAVDLGLVCAAGDTIDIVSKATGFEHGIGVNFQLVKRFTCADGSGTFDARLTVRIDRRGDNFSWTIVDGTGAYAGLHGSGQGYGIPFADQSGVTDYYFGTAH